MIKGFWNRVRPTVVAASTLLVLVACFVWWDTAEYRAAVKNLETSRSTAEFIARAKAMEEDTERWNRCERGNRDDQLRYTDAARNCWLRSMPQVTTQRGSFLFTTSAEQWLTNHPNDEAVRTAALGAVENARRDISAARPYWFAPYDRIVKAENNSFVLRVMAALRADPFLSADRAEGEHHLLDADEVALVIPVVAERQRRARDTRLSVHERQAGG